MSRDFVLRGSLPNIILAVTVTTVLQVVIMVFMIMPLSPRLIIGANENYFVSPNTVEVGGINSPASFLV